MDKVNLDDSIRSALAELQEYLNLQLKYNKMVLGKKMGEIISYLALFILVIGICGFLLFFISFAFVAWFNQIFDIPYAGHLIVAGFYLLMALSLIIFRKPLIFGPIRKLFGQVLFSDEDDSREYEEAFKTSEKLSIRIDKYKKLVKLKGDILAEKFDVLSKELTISNIFQTILRNVYNSFLTTTNVAKAAFMLVRKFSGTKKKETKRKGRNNKDN
jgi:hypothetical protein